MSLRFCAAAMLLATAGSAQANFDFGPYQASPVDGWADAVAVGDVTGDGRDDVVLTTSYYSAYTYTHHVFVYSQQPDGTLAAPLIFPYSSSVTISGLAVGDMNGDGIGDIVVGQKGISIFTHDPRRRGHFRERNVDNGLPIMSVAIVDVDRDGRMDVVGSGWSGAEIFYGDGMGGVRNIMPIDTGRSGFFDLKVADVDNDGFPDLVVAFSGPPDYMGVYYHDRHAGYTLPVMPLDFGAYPAGIAAGDFNHDGRIDIAGSLFNNWPNARISIFYQGSNGAFAPYFDIFSGNLPAAMLASDVTGDGRDDVLVSHDGWSAFGLYQQDPGGFGLMNERSWAVPYFSHLNKQGMASGDLNGDGCVDLAMAVYNVGLVWMYGHGCSVRGDLAVALAPTRDAIVVGLATADVGTPIASPVVQVSLSVRDGILQSGALPEGCVIESQQARSEAVACLVGSMDIGTHTSLVLPLHSTGSGASGRISVSVVATSSTPERTLRNNRSSGFYDLRAAGVVRGAVR